MQKELNSDTRRENLHVNVRHVNLKTNKGRLFATNIFIKGYRLSIPN